MKFTRENISRILPLLTALIAAILLVVAAVAGRTEGTSERVAVVAGKKIEKRIGILEGYAEKMASAEAEVSCREELPEDMVIYKYVNDSLVFWSNQFSVLNDDISSRLVFQRLTNLKSRIISPLTNITENYSYINLGPKWYIVKSIDEGKEKIIAGIEIKNTLIDDSRRHENGVNPALKIPAHFSVLPLNYSGGSPVFVQGEPMFKILADNTSSILSGASLMKWLAMLFICLTSLIFLAGHRNIKAFFITILSLTAVAATAYVWGMDMSENTELFSPNIYADSPLLFSLGALLTINTFITMICFCIYMMRDPFMDAARRSRESRKRNLVIYCILMLATVIGIAAYIHVTISSLLLNSNISLEFYRNNGYIWASILVYASYIGLMFCLLLFMQMSLPAFRELSGRKIDLISRKSLFIIAFCIAVYFSAITAINGMYRENERVEVWANRLAVERDLGLEIRLRAIENDIANDQIISSLVSLDKAEGLIQNRITENFLARIRQNHSLNLTILREDSPELSQRYNNLINSGTPVYEGSRFFFVSDGVGHSRYIGLFMYYSQDKGLSRMFLEIEPDSSLEDRGYNSILGQFSAQEGINLPERYSYAKYSEGKLTSYKGNYPYATVADKFSYDSANESRTIRSEDYTHYIHRISDVETIVISRPKTSAMAFFTSFSYIFLVIFGILSLWRLRKEQKAKSNFFRTRINAILFVSSTMILASMTVVSVFFVYKRNDENIRNLMSSRITTIQALVNRHVKNAGNYSEMMTPGFRNTLEDISKTTKSDISLYSPEGRIFYSSAPAIFDKMILGNRMDKTAFHNIRHLQQRFHINKERVAGYRYQALYAPIINGFGDIIAIACVPYTLGDHDFRIEAFRHAALLVNIFLLLLIVSLLFSTREVNEMFAPLTEMGKKMNINDIHDLQPISYKREDEISSLVGAYNRMVKELAESTVRLAQAERDKAWSQMARQVAHEIKNPLTPIKLEIQRLIRLKENSNPKWEEKFDKVASVVLEHIDILTETANEFSTFAKLYSEEPVLMDLDKTLKDQILIFDNKENISIGYLGMEGAEVMAPRPQLIRVFVNLIANAIQAVEIKQKEMAENGEGTFEGKVFIALRNSNIEGHYDIVVDDNGHGVKDENLDKLFTPNFTTKSGGTGLGLAICRNIIEKCEGTITYSRSFGLGGASFTVTIPKS